MISSGNSSFPPLVLIGGGSMGQALLSGWLESGIPASTIQIIEPRRKVVANYIQRGVTHYESIDAWKASGAPKTLHLLFSAPAVIFAVKPQIMEEVTSSVTDAFGPYAPAFYLSIAAGVSLSTLLKWTDHSAPVIRVMPNIPAMVRRGVSALVASSGASRTICGQAERLMEAVGDAFWVDDEDQMHAVTALSGSGPAYVFAFLEALTESGVKLGLSPSLAAKLALSTVSGAAALAEWSGEDFDQLRQRVTSPGGTTQAALEVLQGEAKSLPSLINDAMQQAEKRSRELSGTS
jgi:pyrroline-5-carboxylate reductase